MATDHLSTQQIGAFQVSCVRAIHVIQHTYLGQDAFNKFDSSGEGSIDTHQLRKVLRFMGQNPTEAELHVNEVDKDGTGSIDFPEFLTMMGLKSNEETAEDELREAFRVLMGYQNRNMENFEFNEYLQDGNGFIDRSELGLMMRFMGESLTDKEIQVGWSKFLCYFALR